MLSTNFVDGAPAWVDLGAPDVARAAAFYGSFYGAEFVPTPINQEDVVSATGNF